MIYRSTLHLDWITPGGLDAVKYYYINKNNNVELDYTIRVFRFTLMYNMWFSTEVDPGVPHKWQTITGKDTPCALKAICYEGPLQIGTSLRNGDLEPSLFWVPVCRVWVSLFSEYEPVSRPGWPPGPYNISDALITFWLCSRITVSLTWKFN